MFHGHDYYVRPQKLTTKLFDSVSSLLMASIIVPPGADHFYFAADECFPEAETEERRFKWPLDKNTLVRLRDLAVLLHLKPLSSLRKADLIELLNKHITDVPLEAVVTEWPALHVDWDAVKSLEDCYAIGPRLAELAAIPAKHLQIHLRVIQRRLDRLHSKLQYTTRRKLYGPPYWWCGSSSSNHDESPYKEMYDEYRRPHMKFEKPSGAHWRVVYREGGESHDNYCSDPGIMFVPEEMWETQTLYIVDTEDKKWTEEDFAIRTWSYGEAGCGGGSGVCGASYQVEVLEVEKVDGL